MMKRACLAALLLLSLSACAIGGRDRAIPFTDASVTSSDNHIFAVAWTAPSAAAVTVYAGTDPDRVGRDHPVGRGGGSGNLTVSDLPAAPRWYFELVPDHGGPLTVADRSLHLATAPNFRDAGGYRTEDGRWVRMGLLYRSDQLDLLSPLDLQTVHEVGIHLVCDLRTDAERARGPDRIPGGAMAMIADVAGNDSSSSRLAGLMTNKSLQQEVALSGGSAKLMEDANRQFVSSPSALKAYHALFERLADPKALPGVFHCTAGKDRTGWAEAVFLSIMGVPRDVILRDYLASNTYLEAKNRKLFALIRSDSDRALVQPMMEVRPDYLEAGFDEIDKRYGSFDKYIHEGLGLDDATINALRAEFLVGG
jgi:protein-tyrosine phosphatase